MIRPTIAFVIILLFLSFLAVSQSIISFKQEIELHRDQYKADFLKESRSPLKQEDLKYLRFYEPDEGFKLVASFKPSIDTQAFEMPTYSGKTKTFMRYGTLDFRIDSKHYRLTVYRNLKLASQPEYRDYLFLPFKDLTSGKETYGGGRYIDLRLNDIKEGNICIVDFNKCYNPYCAYSDGYNCPVPPFENHLDIEIRAGEKLFAKKH